MKKVKPFTNMTVEDLGACIGLPMVKVSGKPFSNKEKTAIVKDVILHPFLGVPAFEFEDAEYCEARQCKIAWPME